MNRVVCTYFKRFILFLFSLSFLVFQNKTTFEARSSRQVVKQMGNDPVRKHCRPRFMDRQNEGMYAHSFPMTPREMGGYAAMNIVGSNSDHIFNEIPLFVKKLQGLY